MTIEAGKPQAYIYIFNKMQYNNCNKIILKPTHNEIKSALVTLLLEQS